MIWKYSKRPQFVEKRGPSVKVAFDQDGKPTQAAQAFAKSCGVAPAGPDETADQKRRVVAFPHRETGAQRSEELLPGIIADRVGCPAGSKAHALGKFGRRIRPSGALGFNATRRGDHRGRNSWCHEPGGKHMVTGFMHQSQYSCQRRRITPPCWRSRVMLSPISMNGVRSFAAGREGRR